MSTQFFRIYMAPYEEIEQSYMLELLDEWVICIIFFQFFFNWKTCYGVLKQ